jgi:predicted neutral ceramidase superfamily lipid hydrolase
VVEEEMAVWAAKEDLEPVEGEGATVALVIMEEGDQEALEAQVETERPVVTVVAA